MSVVFCAVLCSKMFRIVRWLFFGLVMQGSCVYLPTVWLYPDQLQVDKCVLCSRNDGIYVVEHWDGNSTLGRCLSPFEGKQAIGWHFVCHNPWFNCVNSYFPWRRHFNQTACMEAFDWLTSQENNNFVKLNVMATNIIIDFVMAKNPLSVMTQIAMDYFHLAMSFMAIAP